MPKKSCCCEGGNWVAVPCRYWGGMAFVGYHLTGTGFTGSVGASYSPAMQNYLQSISNHPVFGLCGYYGPVDGYYKFPDENSWIGFGVFAGYGTPPGKIKILDCNEVDINDPDISVGYAVGPALIRTNGGGGGWGSPGPLGGGFDSGNPCNQPICWTYELDTDRKVIYKAWGAGGGALNNTFPGGNGAYAQKPGTYNKEYYACVGYGGLGFKPGRSFTGWTGDVGTVPAGGGQGNGAWGGGAAFVAADVTEPDSAFIIAGGGGGAGYQSSIGGNGGVTVGSDGKGIYGGKGGSQTSGGSGGTGAQDGQGTKGGCGAFTSINGGGGGGGGGKKGGGGGGSGGGYGGGGGSSTLGEYSESATDFGPANICDPDYWVYDVAGLGGSKKMIGNGGYVPLNPYEDGTGMWGKVALNYTSLRCLCDDSKDEVPDKTYICLRDYQAKLICEQTQDCCSNQSGNSGASGASGPAGSSGASGASGSSGSCGYNPCDFLASLNTELNTRGNSGNSGGTADAQDLPYGSGYGGSGLGAFTCPDSAFGLTGLSGATFSDFSGEVEEVLYKTFRYDGELYYLLYQCGVNCSDKHLIPEDAEFTDIGCRPWGDCCQGLWATPVCEDTNTSPQNPNCWNTEQCSCSPISPCVKSFVSCVQNIDDYPDTFYTKKGNWYYIVGKTSLWVPFGDDSYIEQGTIGEIILEDPCCRDNSGGFGGGPQVGASGDCNRDNGDNTEPTNGCCVNVQEAWTGKSPWKANVSVSMEWKGRGEWFPDCNVYNTCDCALTNETTHTFSDSYTITADVNGSFYGSHPEPPCPQPGGGCPNGFVQGIGTYLSYQLLVGGVFGIGLREQCYVNLGQAPCYPSNSGVPTREQDAVPPDALIVATTECVIRDDDNCFDQSLGYYLPQLLLNSGGISGVLNPCENDPGEPTNEGPRVYANGCRVSTYVARLNALYGGKISFTNVAPSDKYWLGMWRDEQLGIPGDLFSHSETDEQYIETTLPSGGKKIIKRMRWTLYYASVAYGIKVDANMTNVPKCCPYEPYMKWYMSGCGRKSDPDFACSPCVACECPDINTSAYVVPTYKTLVQWEENPTVNAMVNPKCYGFPSGYMCLPRYSEMDGPQICNITLI